MFLNSWKKTPPYLGLIKHPSPKGVSILQLIDDYGVVNFSDAFAQYWVNLMWPALSAWEAVNTVKYS